jgi:hypothetical protein
MWECDGSCQAAEKASGEKAEKEKQNSEKRRAYKGSPATWLQRNHEFLKLFFASHFGSWSMICREICVI